MRNLTVPHLRPVAFRPSGPRALPHALDRIAILNNSGHVAGERTHLTGLLASQWRANGIEVIELSGTGTFVEADLLFLNLGRALVPEDYTRFAAQYPVTFNAGAADLRKHRYADGQLLAGSAYKGAVIVRNDTGFVPAAPSSASPLGFLRKLNGRRASHLRDAAASGGSYRIYASINDVPAENFGPGYIVQKFLPEQEGGRFILRQYYFLGDEHFLGVQTSGAAIIHTGMPVSLEEWSPPEKLLELRSRLGLDYGRIDFVLVDGKPFVLSINRSPALPESKEPGAVSPAYLRLGEALAEALVDTYAAMEKTVF